MFLLPIFSPLSSRRFKHIAPLSQGRLKNWHFSHNSLTSARSDYGSAGSISGRLSSHVHTARSVYAAIPCASARRSHNDCGKRGAGERRRKMWRACVLQPWQGQRRTGHPDIPTPCVQRLSGSRGLPPRCPPDGLVSHERHLRTWCQTPE